MSIQAQSLGHWNQYPNIVIFDALFGGSLKKEENPQGILHQPAFFFVFRNNSDIETRKEKMDKHKQAHCLLLLYTPHCKNTKNRKSQKRNPFTVGFFLPISCLL